MLGSLFNDPISFVLYAAALIVAITVHEFAHAYAAERLGDPTPKLMGRLTLNPLAHLDLLGTAMLFLAHFGWGKPVPFDPFNLRHPRRDAAVISFAGPVSNLLTAALSALILRFTILSASPVVGILTILLESIILMNVSLAIFNLVPIHPLDGFKIVEGILPEQAAAQWHQLQGLGIIMIFILVFPLFGSSPVLAVITPIINGIVNLLIPHIPML